MTQNRREDPPAGFNVDWGFLTVGRGLAPDVLPWVASRRGRRPLQPISAKPYRTRRCAARISSFAISKTYRIVVRRYIDSLSCRYIFLAEYTKYSPYGLALAGCSKCASKTDTICLLAQTRRIARPLKSRTRLVGAGVPRREQRWGFPGGEQGVWGWRGFSRAVRGGRPPNSSRSDSFMPPPFFCVAARRLVRLVPWRLWGLPSPLYRPQTPAIPPM